MFLRKTVSGVSHVDVHSTWNKNVIFALLRAADFFVTKQFVRPRRIFFTCEAIGEVRIYPSFEKC